MGRVKIAPTPRAAALNDAMRRAATQISPPTAESIKNDLASTSKATKPAGRNSLPTPRGSQDRATSEPASKRKAANDSKTATKDTKLALRSSAKTAIATSVTLAAVDDTFDMSADAPPSKRQRVGDASPAPRRSARSKAVNQDATPPPSKSLRASGRNLKVPSSVASEVDDATPTPTPATEQGEEGDDKSESVNAQSPGDAVVEGPDSLPSPTSATSDTQVMAINAAQRQDGPPLRETMSLPPPNGPVSEVAAFEKEQIDPVKADPQPSSASPLTGVTLSTVANMPGRQMHYGIPPPGSWIQTPTGLVQVSGTSASIDPQHDDGQPHDLVVTQGVSGPDGTYILPPGFAHLAPPVGANGMPLQYLPSRRGQKVKGRPPPKNPAPARSRASFSAAEGPDANGNNADASNGPSPAALRKQPFKSLVEFPGYPPPNAEIPANYTMWNICQLMPNSLRENNLRAFVQREWSANELCACLQDDARAILNSRQGKDKTMVFQKRMERLKKDLVAKGEYEALLRGPPLREDGRPTWVKRGNVRRK